MALSAITLGSAMYWIIFVVLLFKEGDQILYSAAMGLFGGFITFVLIISISLVLQFVHTNHSSKKRKRFMASEAQQLEASASKLD